MFLPGSEASYLIYADVRMHILMTHRDDRYKPESAIDFHTAITAKYYGKHYRRDNGED